jgi:16S rRNA (uracil1498-N3)-methyltransferase
MPRFFVSDPIIAQKEITIPGPEAHHMQRVLRLRVGDTLDILDGTGKQYRGEIMQQSRHSVTVRILTLATVQHKSALTLVMGQSLIKGDKMDFVIQKATEIGVSELIPFVSSRSVTRFHERNLERRVGRWRRIAVESSKQCGRPDPLKVSTVVEFEVVLRQRFPAARRVILWERGRGRLKDFFRKGDKRSTGEQAVYFLVGPEGGFSDQEVTLARKARFTPLSLGPRILRAETAGLTFVSILQYEWGDLA